ncbi:hypothetical protein [Sporosarcina limicola]|uniref:Uncharacterized protein n=1 Tax=Sporosarcina limicola TaxID=34101 RepID=A0A927MG92_9BACL|nr:hypothetical protein [Sporosarcina limicola]MBE1554063.1 hypothetical protein [Sporosarcina limicola]
MVRSISFVYLFIILAVGYIGGTLLFREMSTTAIEKVIVFYDARVVQGYDASFIRPIGTAVLFFVIAYTFAISEKTRFIVLFMGAVKCVLFGLSSSYLLGSGMKMMEYSIWWFPFQLICCFLFLVYCAVLSPPYFMRTTTRKRRNTRVIPILILLSAAILTIEMLFFYYILR